MRSLSSIPLWLALLLAPAVADAGALEGRIKAAEGIEMPAPLSVAIDDWVCGKDGELPDPRLMLGPERGLANVVVRIPDAEGASPYPPDRAVLDQKGCVFTPHVSVVAPGAELLVRNADPVLHNFRTVAGANPRVNRAQVRDKEDVLRFAKPEILRAECDVHYWMSAVVVVAANAYVVVTGADGSFTIDGLEPGSYELELWHETLGVHRADAVVGADGGRFDFVWPAPAD